MNDMTQAPTPRATILVDSSALLKLAKPVPPDLQAEPDSHTYLEVLPLLAKRGFRVVIPEIVSVETSGVLKNGASLNHAFGKEARRFEEDRFLAPFLKATARGNHPGIRIEPSDQPAEVGKYLTKIYDALALPETISRHGKNPPRGGSLRLAVEKAIMGAHVGTKRDDLGDKAILHRMGNAPQGSVFVLTEDGDLTAAVGEAAAISSRQLAHDLIATGLQVETGLKAETTREMLEPSWLKEVRLTSPVSHRPYDAAYCEAHRFSGLLREAAQEMPPEPPGLKREEPAAAEASTGRAAKFLEKYAKARKRGPDDPGVPG